MDTSFEGWRTCWVQDISEMWTRPSTPSLELDESAVVGDADHLALALRAFGETLVDHLPGMRRQLLETQ